MPQLSPHSTPLITSSTSLSQPQREIVRAIALFLITLGINASIMSSVEARPSPIQIISVSAPHPKHCFDERQWLDAMRFSPYNAIDGDAKTAWSPCLYALEDAGYTINFSFQFPIEVDGMVISQLLSVESTPANTKRRSRARARAKSRRAKAPESRKRFTKVQVLFFNSSISDRYPIYFQEVLFEGEAQKEFEYRERLKWNPILIADSSFDERREALGLDASGINPPLEIDRVGLVFWGVEGIGAPPALRDLSFKLKGKRYPVKIKRGKRAEHAQEITKAYQRVIADQMYLSDDRAVIFARSGTIWGMEGEEEVAKVMGAWRESAHGVEVDLSPQQRKRTSAKTRRSLKRKRAHSYGPLHLIIDEAPDRVVIKNTTLAGEYQITRAPVPTLLIGAGQDETPPLFEAP